MIVYINSLFVHIGSYNLYKSSGSKNVENFDISKIPKNKLTHTCNMLIKVILDWEKSWRNTHTNRLEIKSRERCNLFFQFNRKHCMNQYRRIYQANETEFIFFCWQKETIPIKILIYWKISHFLISPFGGNGRSPAVIRTSFNLKWCIIISIRFQYICFLYRSKMNRLNLSLARLGDS